MQRARCYLLGETAVVLELEPPVTLESQKRIWRLAQRLVGHTERLQLWWEECDTLEPESREVSVPVVYGGEYGPDLGEIARHSGLSEKQVVELHSSVEYVVWFLGFQPGFPYFGGLPEQLAMPRRAEPRLLVPAGSVGIGGAQTGIYPLATPGGWQLLGRTPLALFDPKRKEPVLLRSGDRVRFVPQKEGVC